MSLEQEIRSKVRENTGFSQTDRLLTFELYCEFTLRDQ